MNNRGQSLVTFVLLVPIMFLILFMVYEIGQMVSIKNELNSINYLAIDYGLDNLTSSDVTDKIDELIRKNNEDIDNIIVDVSDDKINITLSKRYIGNKTLFKNSDLLMIRSRYVGYIEDGKKVIKDNKGD